MYSTGLLHLPDHKVIHSAQVMVGDGAVIFINANLVDHCWCKELWVCLGVFRFQFHESSWQLMSRTCGPIYTGTNVQFSWRPLALFSVIRGRRRRRRRLLEHCLICTCSWSADSNNSVDPLSWRFDYEIWQVNLLNNSWPLLDLRVSPMLFPIRGWLLLVLNLCGSTCTSCVCWIYVSLRLWGCVHRTLV